MKINFTTIGVTCGLLVLSLWSCATLNTDPSDGDVQASENDNINSGIYAELYRPQIHYTPANNWMNDPNGMVYHDGEYHLFYQYNPFGDTWGHMSWGHAVSTDMIHWGELDVAMYEEDGVMKFSGSAVVDHNNTSGFGTNDEPPLIAIYTGHRGNENLQTQDIAYSTDNGRTWTQYENNPVIDIGSSEFRDPKVIWHDETERWVMAVALSQDRKISFYGSDNLRDWEHLSNFGPAGALGGVWECPELFKLPVGGDPNNTRWVLQVDIGSGSIAGGSGGMYFIGDFDGTEFHLESPLVTYEKPDGTVFEDFSGDDYGDWIVEGEAFGDKPAEGAFEGQQAVIGYIGDQLVNSFIDGDEPQGSLTSPEFTIEKPYISFLIGGGNHPEEVGIKLLIDDELVRWATGSNAETLDWKNWDVSSLQGETARIRIFDYHSGGWGHINVDNIMFRDEPVKSNVEQTLWVDYGADFYAAQSWSDVPEEDGRRKWLAWMSNWDYANILPTDPWRSAQSIPRNVTLRNTPEGIRLYQEPVVELQALRSDHAVFTNRIIDSRNNFVVPESSEGKLFEIVAEFYLKDAEEFGFKVRKGEGEQTIVGYLADSEQMFVDRRNSGEVDFSPVFPAMHKAPLATEDGKIRLNLIVDWSSVEVFGNNGYSVITDLIFPSENSKGIELYSRGGDVHLTRMDIWQLESAWN